MESSCAGTGKSPWDPQMAYLWQEELQAPAALAVCRRQMLSCASSKVGHRCQLAVICSRALSEQLCLTWAETVVWLIGEQLQACEASQKALGFCLVLAAPFVSPALGLLAPGYRVEVEPFVPTMMRRGFIASWHASSYAGGQVEYLLSTMRRLCIGCLRLRFIKVCVCP